MSIKEENIVQENPEKENIINPKKEQDTLIEENPKKENIIIPKKEQDILIHELVLSFLHKLKACFENVMEVFGMICLFFGQAYKYEPEIYKQNEKFNIAVKKEMDEFEREKQEIIREKKESIRKIYIERRNRIKESDEKYNKVLSYLDTIKNDKDKLIEFLKRKNIF